jgi:NTP pyrophosphatase (non-canonical NTP hydrolase)
MSRTVDLGFRPNPEDALDVLAFVLCPANVFAPDGDEAELEVVREIMRPAKSEAIKRWADAASVRRRN